MKLFIGQVPFTTTSLAFYARGVRELSPEPLKKVINDDLVAMVAGLLKVNPEERISIQECSYILNIALLVETESLGSAPRNLS